MANKQDLREDKTYGFGLKRWYKVFEIQVSPVVGGPDRVYIVHQALSK
jgi:hypothetical protein